MLGVVLRPHHARAGLLRGRLCLLALLALSATFTFLASAQAPLLARPDGGPAPRSRYDRRMALDCADHGVWRTPEGWTTSGFAGGVLAVSPDGSAAVARVPARPRLRDDAGFSTLVHARIADLAGTAPALGPVMGDDINRWRRERFVEGSVRVGGQSLRVLGHATRTAAVWLGVHREPDAAARSAIEAAIASWAMLVSHACECRYDCDHR